MASNEQETYECDALVVGSGCAGMSAAVTAGHHGLNVLIVEKEPRLALQLLFLGSSESMGNHDSNIVDADSVD